MTPEHVILKVIWCTRWKRILKNILFYIKGHSLLVFNPVLPSYQLNMEKNDYFSLLIALNIRVTWIAREIKLELKVKCSMFNMILFKYWRGFHITFCCTLMGPFNIFHFKSRLPGHRLHLCKMIISAYEWLTLYVVNYWLLQKKKEWGY